MNSICLKKLATACIQQSNVMKISINSLLVNRLKMTLNTSSAYTQTESVNRKNSTLRVESFIFCVGFQTCNPPLQLIYTTHTYNLTTKVFYLYRSPSNIRGAPV